jgi:twinkle protein
LDVSNHIDFENEYIEHEKLIADDKVNTAQWFKKEVAEYLANGDRIFGDELPWSKVSDRIRVGQGQVSVWAGAQGSGKSTMLGQVLLGLVHTRKILIASFEMTPAQTLGRMCKQAAGCCPPESWSNEFLDNVYENTFIYTENRKIDPIKVLGLCHWAFHYAGIDHLVIDSMTKVGIRKSNYDAQADFIDALQQIAKYYGKHIHLVCHLRKTDANGKGSADDVKGAGEITDLADNVFMITRNEEKEDAKDRRDNGRSLASDIDLLAKPDTYIKIAKNRHFSKRGTFGLWFDEPSQQFRTSEGAPAIQVQCTHDAQIFRGAA